MVLKRVKVKGELANPEIQAVQALDVVIPHPPWPLLISDVGLELEGTLINCSLL